MKTAVITIDFANNGLTLGRHLLPPLPLNFSQFFPLALPGEKGIVKAPLKSRYQHFSDRFEDSLELLLMKLLKNGTLKRTTVIFGRLSDPLHNLSGRSEEFLKLIKLFKRYVPLALYLQTRFPQVVGLSSILKRVESSLIINLSLETESDNVSKKYTPSLPLPSHRLEAASILKKLGFVVALTASPLLPYGEWKKDAFVVADRLVQVSDYLSITPLFDGRVVSERKLKESLLAKQLSNDRKYHWLRSDASDPLIQAIGCIKPESLEMPTNFRNTFEDAQLRIFAA
jgi:hypothetical protein